MPSIIVRGQIYDNVEYYEVKTDKETHHHRGSQDTHPPPIASFSIVPRGVASLVLFDVDRSIGCSIDGALDVPHEDPTTRLKGLVRFTVSFSPRG